MPDANAAAVEAMAGAIMRPDVRDHWDRNPDPGVTAYYRERAADGLAALATSAAVRAALVDVGATGLVKDWNRRPYVGQTAQEDAEAVVDAILAALAPGEAG